MELRGRWMLLLVVLVLLLGGCEKTELGITVHLVPGNPGSVKPMTPQANMSWDKANHVRWINDTDVQQKVLFVTDNWPFMEPYSEIVIEAKARSPWFTMLENGTVGRPHQYKVTPLLDGQGPDEPAITDGP